MKLVVPSFGSAARNPKLVTAFDMSGKLCKEALPKDCDEFLVPPKGGLRGIIESDPHADARAALDFSYWP